jgi:UDP-2,3-diacylglucosamine pyrophosphatase LpxH
MKDIIILGDPHSVFALRQMVNKVCSSVSNTAMICVGDCGFGIWGGATEDALMASMHQDLSRKNNKLFIIRGNHDDPSYFTNDHPFNNYSNISLVTDYSRVFIPSVLFIGGAVSVDRLDRIASNQKTVWWPDEILVYKDCSHMKDIQIVISHTAPSFCEPLGFNTFVKNYIKKEKEAGLDYLEEQLLQERESLTKIYEELSKNNKITHWFYGHFHKNISSVINDTKFICVDQNDYYDVRN